MLSTTFILSSYTLQSWRANWRSRVIAKWSAIGRAELQMIALLAYFFVC